jgi:hypothetical protein
MKQQPRPFPFSPSLFLVPDPPLRKKKEISFFGVCARKFLKHGGFALTPQQKPNSETR